MILFTKDYSEGCHENILKAVNQTNYVQTDGYGTDEYCEEAKSLIKDACSAPNSDVHFLVGGTQTNFTVIASALRPYQGVISAVSGHINVHETGAVEATGHKVIPLPSDDGKITANQVEECFLKQYNSDSAEHEVQPKMVYISNSTEVGTVYSKAELTELSEVCRKYGMYLFLDGARLGYALTCEENDLDLKTIAKLCDIFYIGGTKVGALFGEAVVITNDNLKKDFRYMIKRGGGMLAKGRLLGIQFKELFKDSLYFEIAKNANIQAMKIKNALEQKGYSFLSESPTNQLFPILPNGVLEVLSKDFAFEIQGKADENHTAVRICTSWATTDEQTQKLIDAICQD